MLPLVRHALATPVVRLHLQFIAPKLSVLSPLSGRHVRSALYDALGRLERRPPHVRSAALYAQAKEACSAQARSGVGKPGLHFVPYVLGLPWAPTPVGPELPFDCALTLFGWAALTWPAWVDAAEALRVKGQPLQLHAAAVEGLEGPLPIEEWRANPRGAVGKVADLAGPRLAVASRIRLHLLTPTRWHKEDCFDPGGEISLGDVVRGLTRRLMNLTGRKRSPEEMALERELPECLWVCGRALAAVRAWWPSTRQGGTPVTSGGLVGHLDLAPVERPEIPHAFLDLLWAVQVVHLGRDAAYGCGRVWLEPLDG